MSAAFAVRDDAGNRRLERTALADALELSGELEAVVSFRDPRTGFGVVATVREIRERGLELHLAAYENHAFTEIAEHAQSEVDWRRLADRLGSAGAASLDDAVAAIRHEPVHEPVRAAVIALPDLDAARSRLEAAIQAAGADPSAVAVAVERVARASARDRLTGDPVEAAARLGWAALAWLPGPAAARRQAVDEQRLTWPLAAAFAARGLDEGNARAAASRARFLVGVPLPGEVGRRADPANARAAALVEAWLADPELRAAVGHHRWESVDYVSAEGWRALATTTSDLAEISDPSRSAVRPARALARRLIAVAHEAGYRVDAIRAALAVPRRGSEADG